MFGGDGNGLGEMSCVNGGLKLSLDERDKKVSCVKYRESYMECNKMSGFDAGIYIFDALAFAQLSPYVLRAVEEFRRFSHFCTIDTMNDDKVHKNDKNKATPTIEGQIIRALKSIYCDFGELSKGSVNMMQTSSAKELARKTNLTARGNGSMKVFLISTKA